MYTPSLAQTKTEAHGAKIRQFANHLVLTHVTEPAQGATEPPCSRLEKRKTWILRRSRTPAIHFSRSGTSALHNSASEHGSLAFLRGSDLLAVFVKGGDILHEPSLSHTALLQHVL